jgi:threonine/homoserine/homoserine lactone efflux protein
MTTHDLNIWTALVAFATAAGLLTIIPGLDTMLVFRTAIAEGRHRAMGVGLGICAGCLVWGLLVSVGLGAILAVSTVAYSILRLIGACYLVYRSPPDLSV